MITSLSAALIAAVVDGAGIAGTLTYAAVRAGATLPAAPTSHLGLADTQAPAGQVTRRTPPHQSSSHDPAATYRQMATQGRVFGSHRADDTGEILPPTAYGVATPTARIHEMPTGGMDTRAVVAAAAEARQQQIREQEALSPVPVTSSRFRPHAADGILGLHRDDDWDARQPIGDWAQTGRVA